MKIDGKKFKGKKPAFIVIFVQCFINKINNKQENIMMHKK